MQEDILTPRQKVIVLLLLGIFAFSAYQLVQKYQTWKQYQKSREQYAETERKAYENMQKYGYSYDPDNPLAKALDEYKAKEEQRKLEEQHKAAANGGGPDNP